MTTTCTICDKPISGLEQFGPIRAPVCSGCWPHWNWSDDLDAWIPLDPERALRESIRRPYCWVLGRDVAGLAESEWGTDSPLLREEKTSD